MVVAGASRPQPNNSFHVLGIHIVAMQIVDVIGQMETWIAEGRAAHFIAVSNVHVVVEAQRDHAFRETLDHADLCVPDGMPLIWLGRLRGNILPRRVYGPDLLLEFCRATHEKGYRHYFYGGVPGVPEALVERLKMQFPNIKIAGLFSPPFHAVTPEENAKHVEVINQSRADVLWVGLGCPKQERWMYEHRDRLRIPVLVGIGQAFDIHSGRSKQAPAWLRNHGGEWLYRLLCEPRRLWRRYLLYNSQFVLWECLEILGLKRYE